MSFLVRKIAINKWMQTDIRNGALPSADAITGCTRTHDNALSVWAIEEEEELEDAILAIASAGQHLEKIDVVLLDRNSIESIGAQIASVPGETPYKGFVSRHFDVGKLDYGSLGRMSVEIVSSIKNERHKNFTRSRLKAILANGVATGKIQHTDLCEGVRKCIPAGNGT